MFGPIVLGPRVRLRPPRTEDAAEWARWRGDPDVSRFAWPATAGVPTVAQVEGQLAEMGGADDRVLWIVELDGRPLGLTFLSRIDWVARHAYHGYAIGDRAMWGRGYASETSALAVGYGFTSLGLNKIKAEVAQPHVPSQRVLEKQGFRRCGVFREEQVYDGVLTDMIWFEVLRDEWTGAAK